MPNQLSPLVEQRIVAFALGHPGLGPRRIAAELARPRWGGVVVSANGVWRCLRRHGLNTRAKRLSLVAGYAAPYEPPRPAPPPQHVEAERPGELVGFDCFFVGRLQNMKETVWQLTAIDVCCSYAWAELVSCKHGQPSAAQTSKLARRVVAELRAAGWRLERALTDNGSEFRGSFEQTIERLGARTTRIRAGRPQTNGAVESLHKTILDECWPRLRPLSPGPLPRPAPRPRRLPPLLRMKVIHEEAGLSQGHGLRGVGRLAAGGGGGWCGDAPVIHPAALGGPECRAGLGGSIKFGGRPVVARPDFHASSPERCERVVRGTGRVQVVDGRSSRRLDGTRARRPRSFEATDLAVA